MHILHKILLGCAILFCVASLPLGVIEDLGATPAEAQEEILNQLATDGNLPTVPYQIIVPFKKMSVPMRVVAVKALGDFAKAYVSTEAFVAKYRARKGPGAQPNPAMAQQYDEAVKQMEENLAQMEKSMKDADANTRSLMEPSLKGMRDALALYRRQRDEVRTGAQPKYRIAELLATFLSDTDALPWDAKLIEENGHNRFLEPAHEAMPVQRKFYYRCGRETITAARSYAQAWLKEIQP